jgi:hypothetical protein
MTIMWIILAAFAVFIFAALMIDLTRLLLFQKRLLKSSLSLLNECELLIEQSALDIEHADVRIQWSRVLMSARSTLKNIARQVVRCAADPQTICFSYRIAGVTQPLSSVISHLKEARAASKADIEAAKNIRSLREQLRGQPLSGPEEDKFRYGDLAVMNKDYEVALREFRALTSQTRKQ